MSALLSSLAPAAIGIWNLYGRAIRIGVAVAALFGLVLWGCERRDDRLREAVRAEERAAARTNALEAVEAGRDIKRKISDADASTVWDCLSGHRPCVVQFGMFAIDERARFER